MQYVGLRVKVIIKSKIHKIIFLTIMLCLVITLGMSVSHISWAWDADMAKKDLSFQKGRIWKTDGYKIEFSTANITGDIITYKPSHSKEEKSFGVDQVMKVEVEKGSYALEYGIGVGAAGFLGATVGVNTQNTEGYEPSSSAKNSIVLSLTAVSGLIGAAIGAGQKKYETVYSNPEFNQKSSIRILPEINIENKAVGFRVSYRY